MNQCVPCDGLVSHPGCVPTSPSVPEIGFGFTVTLNTEKQLIKRNEFSIIEFICMALALFFHVAYLPTHSLGVNRVFHKARQTYCRHAAKANELVDSYKNK